MAPSSSRPLGDARATLPPPWWWIVGSLLLVSILRAASAPAVADAAGHTWSRGESLGYFACHVSLPPGYEHSEVRFKLGNDEAWAQPGWNDLAWDDVTDRGVPQRAGIFWLRFRVRPMASASELEDSDRPMLPDGIFMRVNASFDLFWDGKLLARSGVPGNRAGEEEPGQEDTVFNLPESWREPREHVVALRMSTHYSEFPGEWTDLNTGLQSTQVVLTQFHRESFRPTLVAGAMTMVAMMAFLIWVFADRRPALLLFVGICVCAALTQWLALSRYYYSYTYDWHFPSRVASMYVTAGFGAFLLMFVVTFFDVPHRWWWLGCYAGLIAFIIWLPREYYVRPINYKAGWEATAALVLACGGASWAAWHRQRGAGLVATGLLISTILLRTRPGGFMSNSFLSIMLPMMIGLLAGISLRLREERKQAVKDQLTATRLEIELLKKNLQPHFLMNTLTTLSEVIEQNPRMAATLIDDLATELRTLARMSGEKQVPFAQEIELCRAHLRVMSVRTGVAWSFTTEGVEDSEAVPPAIILTLMENSFVHQRTTSGEAVFHLRREVRDGEVRYTFRAPGEVRPPKRGRATGGTGLRYVKARLEESFPGRWVFAHQAAAGAWETVITVRLDGGEQSLGHLVGTSLIRQPS